MIVRAVSWSKAMSHNRVQRYLSGGSNAAHATRPPRQPAFAVVPTIGLPWPMQQMAPCQRVIYELAVRAAQEQIGLSSFRLDWSDYTI